jgi:hypothetical protein
MTTKTRWPNGILGLRETNKRNALDAAAGASGMKPKGRALTDVDKDVEFWESLMPPGFRLNGWTYRSSATLLTPTNRTWQVTAELLRQIRSAFNV